MKKVQCSAKPSFIFFFYSDKWVFFFLECVYILLINLIFWVYSINI